MTESGRFQLSDSAAQSIAKRFGTPVYVVDESTFRSRIRRYRTAMETSWPQTRLAYASKANSILAVNAIAYSEGCLIDAASEGEIEAALRAGVPPSSINLHGVAKTDREIDRAISLGLGQIIVDNASEIERLASRTGALAASPTRLILRLAPGVDPITHEAISTGQEDTKFGMNIADGSARTGLAMCLEAGLPVDGFHAHVGSQLLDPGAQIASAERLARFAADMRDELGFEAKELNLGGGLGATYVAGEEPLPIEDYVRRVNEAAGAILRSNGMQPTLIHEPGRSLICEAGVTLYRLELAKRVMVSDGSAKLYLIVNGGLADNPRPALYGARYDVLAVPAEGARPATERTIPATVSGRHCETDALFRNVAIDSWSKVGDYLQVLSTGAYNASMVSEYNRYLRPRTVLVRTSGEEEIVQDLDGFDEMFARERVPQDI